MALPEERERFALRVLVERVRDASVVPFEARVLVAPVRRGAAVDGRGVALVVGRSRSALARVVDEDEDEDERRVRSVSRGTWREVDRDVDGLGWARP